MSKEAVMEEGGAAEKAARKDRKLGDEWKDWNSGKGREEAEIDESAGVFLSLSAAVLTGYIILVLLGWYLIEPRVSEFNPAFAGYAGTAVGWGSALVLLAAAVQAAVLISVKRSALPYRVMEKLFLALLPRTVWLGLRFGISRDRTGNSFIKLNNALTMASLNLQGARVLVLLPRCLTKEARNTINEKARGGEFKVYTAAGGEEAREAIAQYRPGCILAIACERDLMSGLKDVAEKIPVLAIPNRRPEGPCKNTVFAVEELEEALRAFKESKLKRIN